MVLYPPNTFTTPNRVVLVGRGREDEVPCSADVYPGMLLQDDGAAGVKPHAILYGAAEVMIALEQGLRGLVGAGYDANGVYAGKGTWDKYTSGEACQFYRAGAGDLLNVLLANGENAAEGKLLGSDGAGHFKVMATGNLYETTAASADVTNTTTETKFSTGSFTLPANMLQPGDIVRIRAQGIATATNATDTLTAKLYLGGLTGTLLVSTGALDVANNDEFLIDALVEIRTNGATGTFIANGTDTIGTPGTSTVKAFLVGSTAIDTTATQEVAVSATWSAASAGDSCRLDYMTVDIVRPGGITPLMVVASAVDNTSGTGTTYPYSPAALVQARVLR